jgi:Bacterial protein of unknown function (DUF916)
MTNAGVDASARARRARALSVHHSSCRASSYRGLRGLVAVAAVLGWLCLGPPVADAAGPEITVSVHPASGVPASYFMLNARPGARACAGWLQIANPTSRELTVRLDPVNGLTASTLGSLYASPARADQGSTRWLAVSTRSVSVPPQSTRSVEVAVIAPRSATPGDYLSGIAVETAGTAQTTRAAHGLEIGEAYRYVVGVETKLPGLRRPHIRFTGAQVVRYPSTVIFLLSATNDGNVILKNVHGWVSVKQGAKSVVSETVPPGTFVSHTSIQLPVSAPHAHPSAGAAYRVRAELVYEGGVAYLDTRVTFGRRAAQIQAEYTPHGHAASGVPWPVLAGAAAAVLLLLLGSWWVWRRRRRALSPRATLSLLERQLARSRKRGTTLSVICLDVEAPRSRALERRVVKLIRPALRSADAVGDLGDGRMLVILPGTGESLAEGLASELTTLLAAAGLGHAVGHARCATPAAHVDVDELLAQAAPHGHDDQSDHHVSAPASA